MKRGLDEITLSEVAAVGDLARVLGLKHPSAINNWAKRFRDFPEHVATIGGTKVWVTADVVEWHGRFKAGRAGVTENVAARAGLS